MTDTNLSERILAFWEVVSVVSSVLIAEWLALSLVRENHAIFLIPVVLAFGLMLSSHRLRRESLRDIGIRLDNLHVALFKLTLPTLIIAGLIVGTGWLWGGLHSPEAGSRTHYLLLPLWALMQQYALQGFMNRRFQMVFGKGWLSIIFVAAVFGLLHLPNPFFAALTFVAGVIWAAAYQRTPNLFALALSHSLLAFLLSLSMPFSWVHGLRVGFKYFS